VQNSGRFILIVACLLWHKTIADQSCPAGDMSGSGIKVVHNYNYVVMPSPPVLNAYDFHWL